MAIGRVQLIVVGFNHPEFQARSSRNSSVCTTRKRYA